MFKSYFLTRLTSKIVRFLATLWIPLSLRDSLWRTLALKFEIDLSEAKIQELTAFSTFDALFTRELKAGIRPIADTHLVSPADGRLTMAGNVVDGKLIQAKGIYYPVTPFLRQSLPSTGSFATIYLSPKDCHRVMSPVDGELLSIAVVPGALVPVREPYVSCVPNLFGLNERLVFMIKTSKGLLSVVMVGALNVGTMTTPFSPLLKTHRWGDGFKRVSFSKAKKIKKGDLLGIFHLGSTVVLVSDFKIAFSHPSGPIQIGEALG